MQKLIYALMGLMVLLCLTSCGAAKPLEADDFAMGTVITQKIYGANAQKASDEVITKIKDLEALITLNSPGGDVNKLNGNAGLGYVSLNPETMSVLKMPRKFRN